MEWSGVECPTCSVSQSTVPVSRTGVLETRGPHWSDRLNPPSHPHQNYQTPHHTPHTLFRPLTTISSSEDCQLFKILNIDSKPARRGNQERRRQLSRFPVMFEVEIFGGGHGHLHHGSNVMGAGEMSLDGRGGEGRGGENLDISKTYYHKQDRWCQHNYLNV